MGWKKSGNLFTNCILHDTNLGVLNEIHNHFMVFRFRQIGLDVLNRLGDIHAAAINHTINILDGIDTLFGEASAAQADVIYASV